MARTFPAGAVDAGGALATSSTSVPRSMPSATASSTVARYSAAHPPRRRSDAALEPLAELAPLHNPPASPPSSLQSLWPELPQVACFDTASTSPCRQRPQPMPCPTPGGTGAAALRLPRAQPCLGQPAGRGAPRRPREELRLVTAHLGAGASLAAVVGRPSVDTTMGFTPLEGLVMATRSGSVDPGLLFWVQRHGDLSVDEVEDLSTTSRAGRSVGGVRRPARGADRHGCRRRTRPSGLWGVCLPAPGRRRRHVCGHGRARRPGVHGWCR